MPAVAEAQSCTSAKKRGRKPRDKSYSLVVDETPALVVQEEPENIILHLRISSEDATKAAGIGEHIFNYSPDITEVRPFTPDIPGSFLKDQVREVNEFRDKKHDRVIRNLLVDLHGDALPARTDVHCWWCCHAFDSEPFGIPLSQVDGVFHVSGVFCSPNCACAHLVNDTQSHNQMWASYSLLQMLCRKAGGCAGSGPARLRMAPPRQALRKFGGFMSVDEFRQTFQQGDKEYKLLLPPMTVVIPQIEECAARDGGTPIPVNWHRMQVATDAIKLKRSKPVHTGLTLESFMKIQTVQAC